MEPRAEARLRIAIRGAVQGVGFRPFIYRLATELELAGWVLNSAQGVFIEAEGAAAALTAFLHRIEAEKPAAAIILVLEPTWLDPAGLRGFTIRHSDDGGARTALIMPDLATCADCLRDLRDPSNRRYRYPFTNCTNCGPRLSIVLRLPYDRPHTTMSGFPMCAACQAEYDDPLDRRFHAQPNACPDCGPQVALWEPGGRVAARGDDAVAGACAALREGRIVAVKGIGGFHLMVDARSEDAVARLRTRKRRDAKPLALLYPSLETARRDCLVSEIEARALASPQAPIVLLERSPARGAGGPADGVAPDSAALGVMLPYAPLHHLLAGDLGFALVATSGNLSDEPMCIDEEDALARLNGIADAFLVHDRPIARHVDDSVVRVIAGRELVMRRGRGYAPLPVTVQAPLPPALGVGAQLKNTVAFSVGAQVFVSQHIGDLETVQAHRAFARVAADFGDLYGLAPQAVGCDLHPDYLSTRFARETGIPVTPVQHHVAHALSCMAENDIACPFLAVAWDGTGYGPDGTIWGGEFLRIDETGYERIARLRPFPLPGGEAAVREPRRSAAGLLWEMLGAEALERDDLPPARAFTAAERSALRAAMRSGVNTPRTSSAGRLFDAAACLAGLRDISQFEGQAAMGLEARAAGHNDLQPYPVALRTDRDPAEVDWAPMVAAMLVDAAAGVDAGAMAARFHAALAEVIARVAEWSGLERVGLTGGCFQNARLTEGAIDRLTAAGRRVYWHQRIPPNDGGISLGQVVEAGRRPRKEP